LITILCGNGHENVFDQPHPYHAGPSDIWHAYNDDGDLTIFWSSYDPALQVLINQLPDGWSTRPWSVVLDHVEAALPPAPHGGRWRFDNSARCRTCGDPIEAVPGKPIYVLVYPGSIDLTGESGPTLGDILGAG
jgi:hypothetical protein